MPRGHYRVFVLRVLVVYYVDGIRFWIERRHDMRYDEMVISRTGIISIT